MVELSENTEALARRIAVAQDLSVDEAIRQALEARAYLATSAKTVAAPSAELVAERRKAIDDIVARVASLPILDPRSSQEIMDDLDPL